MMESLLADVRFAVRWLRRSPGFTAVAVVSLAVGIGFNTALFSLVDAVLFRPAPVTAPHELVTLFTTGSDGDPYATSSYPDYLDLKASSEVFSDVAGYSAMITPIALGDRSRLALGALVTGNYFSTLGVPAALGRTLTPDDDRPGAEAVAMISYRHWQQEFGGDPAAIGRTLRLRGQPYTIVGVAPATMPGVVPLFAAELWLPATRVEDVEPAGIIDAVPSPTGITRLERRGQRWLFLQARLRPGATLEQARANVGVIAGRLASAHPQTNRDRRMTLLPSSAVRVHPTADRVMLPIGLGLMALVGLLLLVACGNVASMLLARAAARRREVGIRVAIGASRARVVRQLLTESVVLALLGAAAGGLLAWWLMRLIATAPLPLPLPVLLDVRLDVRVLIFMAGVSVAAGLAAGLAPALRAARTNLVPDLRGESPAGDIGGRRWSMRDLLVTGQIAVTALLLVAGGLLARSLGASRGADLGFDPRGLAILSMDPEMAGYDADGARQFYDRALARIRALPGVQSAATAWRLPFTLNFSEDQFEVPGHRSPDDRGFTILNTPVSPEYFRTLGIAILEGRGIVETDAGEAPRVAVVSAAMARRFWPRESAIGRRIDFKTGDRPPLEIVGVAADHRVRTIGEDPQPYIYLPFSDRRSTARVVFARTSGDAGQLLTAMRRELLALEPGLIFLDDQTMETQVAAALLPVRIGATVGAAAGLVALGLAAVGLYGVVAYSVTRRTREIGIRVALGADRARVIRLVGRQGLPIVAGGLVVGCVLAAAGVRAMAGMLYGISTFDPAAWLGALVTLVAVSGLAHLVPAYRAQRVEASVALRSE